MTKFKIGAEVHASVPSKKKLFCSCNISEKKEMNKIFCCICIGEPGTKPQYSEEQYMACLKTKSLFSNGERAEYSSFYRKHYYYKDLPKGYQLTTEPEPFIKDCFFEFGNKKYEIAQVHIEEDPASTKKDKIDFNRCGAPLVEITTKFFYSKEEFLFFLNALVLSLSDIYSTNTIKWKCDVNISLFEQQNRSEIKNLNSFENISNAIDFELSRIINIFKKGKIFLSSTRHYNSLKKKTSFLRTKESKKEYLLLREPELLCFSNKIKLKKNLNQKIEKLIAAFSFEQILEMCNTSIHLINFLWENFDILSKKPNLVLGRIKSYWSSFFEFKVEKQQLLLAKIGEIHTNYHFDQIFIFEKKKFLNLNEIKQKIFEKIKEKKIAEEEIIKRISFEIGQIKKNYFIDGKIDKEYILELKKKIINLQYN